MLKEQNEKFLQAFPANMREWMGKLVEQVSRFEVIADRIETAMKGDKKPQPSSPPPAPKESKADKRRNEIAEIQEKVLARVYPVPVTDMTDNRGASAHHIINGMTEKGFIRRRVSRLFDDNGKHTDLSHTSRICYGTKEQWARYQEADYALLKKGL